MQGNLHRGRKALLVAGFMFLKTTNFSILKSLILWYLGSCLVLSLLVAIFIGDLPELVFFVIFVALIPTLFGAFLQKWIHEFRNRQKVPAAANESVLSQGKDKIDYLALVATLAIALFVMAIFNTGFVAVFLLVLVGYPITRKLNKKLW